MCSERHRDNLACSLISSVNPLVAIYSHKLAQLLRSISIVLIISFFFEIAEYYDVPHPGVTKKKARRVSIAYILYVFYSFITADL